jgi:glycosyltransferase involved in cell wall biosynthesis
LIDDGWTDRSGAIADQYAKRDSRIKVIHQVNGGASKARNVGLELAQGEYIVYIDSDDWVKENSLFELVLAAKKFKVDVLIGKVQYWSQEGNSLSPFSPVPDDLFDVPISGKDCFVRLMNVDAYFPMPFGYICHREYLNRIQVRFEEGIMHEDELWTPVMLCLAEKVVIVGCDYYYYRQHESSVMHTTNRLHRLKSMFTVTEGLMDFAGRFEFTSDDCELKSWLYVIIFRHYAWAFTILRTIKDSSYNVPVHHLDRFWRDCTDMMPKPQQRCKTYFNHAEKGLKIYTEWRTSEWVASIASKMKTEKKLILIYNTPQGEELTLKIEDVPDDWIITTDRRYYLQADVVVCHLPNLYQEIDDDLEKPQGQIWVGWILDSEENSSNIIDSEIIELFDLWMSDKQDIDEEHPLVRLCRKAGEIMNLVISD